MNRIDETFSRKSRTNSKTLVMFLPAGDPDLATSAELIKNIADAGADIIEVGVPFSDPTADGPTIQAASQRALRAGTTLPRIFEMIREVRKEISTPLILFGYYNVFFNYGLEAFARDARQAGVDGLLVVDLPPEEADEVYPALEEHDLHLIPLLAPTTSSERRHKVLRKAGGFIYYVSVTGVTGVRAAVPSDLAEHLKQIKSETALPTVAGFGVSTPDMAREVVQYADGVVVGSALVKTIAEAESREAGLNSARQFVRSLAEAVSPG